MKVLYFHQHFSTQQGSTGTRSYSMARRLVERGHHVTMVCGSYHGADTGLRGSPRRGVRRGRVDGIDVIEIAIPYSNHHGFLRRSLSFINFAVRSTAIALSQPCDVAFATSTPLTAGIPGIAAKWLRGRRFVFEVRDLWPELPRAMGVIRNPFVLAALSILEWCCYRSADVCIGLAPGIVDGIARRGVPRERIAMVPNAADLDLFVPKLSPAHAPAHADCQAVFTGTHGIANGVDAVLDAAAALQTSNDATVRLTFIGDGKLKPKLMARARREGLRNCEFLEPQPKTTLAHTIACADIGLMVLADVPAFYYGTSPNKFFDYLAAGLPVICNYPGWVADLICEHDCGVVVPPGDAEAFAEALSMLAADVQLRARKGRNARALAETRFDRRMLAERFVNTLEKAHYRRSCSAARGLP